MGIVRLFLIIVVSCIVYRVVKTFFFKKQLPSTPPKGSIDEMVQDPQCHIYVPMRQAEQRVIRGKTYFFCSKRCAEDFERKNQ